MARLSAQPARCFDLSQPDTDIVLVCCVVVCVCVVCCIAVLGALAGQVLVWTAHPLWQLFVPTLTAVAVSLAAFLFLPSQQSQQKLIDRERSAQLITAADTDTAIHAPPPAPSVPPALLFSSLRSVLSGHFTPLSQLLSLLTSQYRHPTSAHSVCT